jgi:hypothetical protein
LRKCSIWETIQQCPVDLVVRHFHELHLKSPNSKQKEFRD